MVNLQAKNFVLNINQTNINALVGAQLEPGQHPAEGRESLGVDDTKYLFLYGQSVSQQDVPLGWPHNADPSTQPPLDLVHGQIDKQLGKTILDYFGVHDLRKRIRDAIFYYRTKWSKFIRKLEHPDRVYDEPTVKNIQFELDQFIKYYLQATVPQIISKQKGGIEMKGDHTYSAELNASEEVARYISLLGVMIDAELWSFKLLFYDMVELVDNLNHSDVLEMFGEEMRLVEMLINYYETNHDVTSQQPESTTSQDPEKVVASTSCCYGDGTHASVCRASSPKDQHKEYRSYGSTRIDSENLSAVSAFTPVKLTKTISNYDITGKET